MRGGYKHSMSLLSLGIYRHSLLTSSGNSAADLGTFVLEQGKWQQCNCKLAIVCTYNQ